MGGSTTDIMPMPTVAEMPGIRFRHFRGVDLDIPGMFAANQAARLAAGEVELVDVGSMRAMYLHLDRCDPDRDICVIESDGSIAGYARLWWDDLLDGTREYFTLSLLSPELRHRAIRRALLDWTERRRRAIAAEHRVAGDGLERPAWLATEHFDDDTDGAGLLAEAGYTPHRRFATLVRPDLEAIPDLPLPEGIETRPVVREPALLRRIWEAEAEAFLDEAVAREQTEQDFAVFLDLPADLGLWVIAFDGDEVAAGIRNSVRARPDGTLEGALDVVYTRRPWRRRGLARALISRSLVLLREHGAGRAMLGVDLANPNQALALYESCGFRLASSSTAWHKALVLDRDIR